MAMRQFTIEVDEEWLDVLEELIEQSESNPPTLTMWVLETDIFQQFKQQLNEEGVHDGTIVCA